MLCRLLLFYKMLTYNDFTGKYEKNIQKVALSTKFDRKRLVNFTIIELTKNDKIRILSLRLREECAHGTDKK